MTILVIIIAILIIGALSFYIYNESTGFHIVNYNIKTDKISDDYVKIVFISDLHNMQYGEKNQEVVDAVNEIKPDFICLGGDMLTSCLEKWVDFSDTMDFVKTLSKEYKVYYGVGNHEERLKMVANKFPEGTYERLKSILVEINAPLMEDVTTSYNDSIKITGLNLDHRYYRKVITRQLPEDYLRNKLGDIDPGKFNILIAHNPEHFKMYSKWGADLVLSGHVHGGIIRLPLLGGVVSPALKLFPKYDGGLFEEGKSKMILSRGLGTHTIPIRVNNKAELIVIEITKA